MGEKTGNDSAHHSVGCQCGYAAYAVIDRNRLEVVNNAIFKRAHDAILCYRVIESQRNQIKLYIKRINILEVLKINQQTSHCHQVAFVDSLQWEVTMQVNSAHCSVVRWKPPEVPTPWPSPLDPSLSSSHLMSMEY